MAPPRTVTQFLRVSSYTFEELVEPSAAVVMVAQGTRQSPAGFPNDAPASYNAGPVWHDVRAEVLTCGLHRVERLIRDNGLRARPRRRGPPRDTCKRSIISDNILDRAFGSAAPDQKWIADFTYMWTAEGWLYVADLLDEPVGQSLGPGTMRRS